jgi:hypothetical protein
MSELTTALVIGNPKAVETRFGSRVVVNYHDQHGEQGKLWLNPTDQKLKSLVDGSRIGLGRNAKGAVILAQTPYDRAQEAVNRPISPTVAPTPVDRPLGFQVDAPFEAERRLRAQLAAAQPVAIEPTVLGGKIAELGAIYAQCLAVAGGSELAAVEIFKAAIA